MIDKKKLTAIVGKSYQKCGNYETVEFLDKLKDMGFYFAYKSGLSIAIDAIHIPNQKANILERDINENGKIDSKVLYLDNKNEHYFDIDENGIFDHLFIDKNKNGNFEIKKKL